MTSCVALDAEPAILVDGPQGPWALLAATCSGAVTTEHVYLAPEFSMDGPARGR
jgi:hypothetical protein